MSDATETCARNSEGSRAVVLAWRESNTRRSVQKDFSLAFFSKPDAVATAPSTIPPPPAPSPFPDVFVVRPRAEAGL